MINEIIKFNKSFVENKEYERYISDKFPSKKIAILSCMDTRLTELLPAAMGFKNGDVKIIKNAGGVLRHPFGSVMLSLLIAIYELGVEKIFVVGHKDCGMNKLDSNSLINKMIKRGIKKENIDFIKSCGISLDKFLSGFESVEESVKITANSIINHPLIPKDIEVSGFVIDPTTGYLEIIGL